MSDADRRRWDDRYTVGPPPALGTPPELLRDRTDLLPAAGRALDVACGRGATSVWLAQQGLVVDAVDVSSAGLAAAAELADRCGVGARLRWSAHDLDRGLPLECVGPYDLVVCQRFRDPALYPALMRVLAPGGLLAITVLFGAGGPFRAAAGELPAAFAGLEPIIAYETGVEAGLLARRTA